MTSESPNRTTNYIDGREEDYTDCVHVLSEQEAIRPGCTKIKDISVKPITYNCCLRYDIRRTRTAHIFSHYINVDMDKFKECIRDFTVRNMGWINKVGRDILLKSKLTVDSFVKGLVGGTIPFDELCLTVACRAFNIHCIVLLDGSFWTTCPNNQLSDCVLCLAYVGEYGFKEICAKNTAAIDDKITEQYDESDGSSGEEDLVDTGLLNEETDMETEQVTSDSVQPKHGTTTQEESSDSVQPKHGATTQEESSDSVQPKHGATTQEESSDSVDRDIKPLIRFKPHVDVTFNNEPIVILDSEDEQERDVIKFRPSVVSSDTIVISSDSESGNENQDNSDATSTVPQVPRPHSHRIKHDRKYLCYLCDQQFDMQSSFLDHFETDHSHDKYKCEFCETYFDSPNGLFKHERSHLYLKYNCAFCPKLFQFPYQLAAHNTQHTGLGKHKCSICDQMFGSKCAEVFHEKTHDVCLKCELCPKSTEKEYTNSVALQQHQRGMHGPGWTTFCGKNYKWKSRYTIHRAECKKCIKNKADKKLAHFNFLRKMDLTAASD